MAPPAYEDATAPPAYVYYGSGAAQTSAPSNLHDSYNNPTYQVNPPENVYADNSVNENKQKGELLSDLVPFQNISDRKEV